MKKKLKILASEKPYASEFTWRATYGPSSCGYGAITRACAAVTLKLMRWQNDALSNRFKKELQKRWQQRTYIATSDFDIKKLKAISGDGKIHKVEMHTPEIQLKHGNVVWNPNASTWFCQTCKSYHPISLGCEKK